MINPYFDVILAGIIWGSAGAFVKILKLPSSTVTFFRLIVPTFILSIYFLIKKRNVLKSVNKPVAMASVFNGIRMYLYFLAYTLTSIGNAVIILYTWPIFVTIFSSFLLKEKISFKKWSLIIISFIGVVLMFSNSNFSFRSKDFVGMMAMLLSSLMYGLTVPIFKKQLEKFSKVETIFYQNFVAAIIWIPFIFLNRPIPTVNQSIIASFYAGLIGLVGFFLFFSGLKKLKASTASLLSYVEVLSALIFGHVFFKEPITMVIIIGGVIILTSSYLTRFID